MGQKQSYELDGSDDAKKDRRRYKDHDTLLVSCEILKCPVCLDPFQIAPMLFPCGHSVCVDCTALLRSSAEPRNYCCPSCRYAVATYTELKRNFLVGGILDGAKCSSNGLQCSSNKEYDEELSKLKSDLDSLSRHSHDLCQRLTAANNHKSILNQIVKDQKTQINRLTKLVNEKTWEINRLNRKTIDHSICIPSNC